MLNMENALPALPFLARLGLHVDADASAIRRAYARELKLIDQATQADQFQHLRAAYEAALDWAGRSAGTGIGPSCAIGEVDETGAHGVASQVCERFLDACIPLRQKEGLRDQAAWEAALRRHVADPGLLNLSAGLVFEMKIAAYLAAGWKPGNEMLFLVAAEVFEWESDSWRVEQLGEAAVVIAQTLEQRYLFDCQDDAAFRMSRNVLLGLRLSGPPLTMRLKAEMPHLESMLQYFPALVAVTAGMENVARWRALHAQLPRPAIPESLPPILFGHHRSVSQGPAKFRELSVPLTIVVLLIAVVRIYYFVNQF